MILPSIFGSSSSAKISKLEQEVASLKSTKVDNVSGKGLSTNDFTDAYKAKIDGMNTIAPVQPMVVASDDYVTPQMFGAKANGDTDDTDAVQAALDSGKYVFFPRGDYYVTKPIIITNKKFWCMDARAAIISYDGDDFAVKILNACNCCISIGCVYTRTGGGIEFYSDSEDVWNQYVTLYFDFIMAKTDCIKAETSGEGWSNENQVYGGQFAAGENGVNIVSRSHHTINGWKFYNCGIEGVTNGFMFDATEDEETAICNMAISNCRYGESFETILKTNGLVYDCLWLAPSHVDSTIISCSPQTTRFEILAPIGDYWRLGYNRAWHRGCIINGQLMADKTEYELVH